MTCIFYDFGWKIKSCQRNSLLWQTKETEAEEQQQDHRICHFPIWWRKYFFQLLYWVSEGRCPVALYVSFASLFWKVPINCHGLLILRPQHILLLYRNIHGSCPNFKLWEIWCLCWCISPYLWLRGGGEIALECRFIFQCANKTIQVCCYWWKQTPLTVTLAEQPWQHFLTWG